MESFKTNKESEMATSIRIINTNSGLKKELNCQLILLCASTISTLRILLNSEKESSDSGFIDTSGKLGRYLMDHVSTSKFFAIKHKEKFSRKSFDQAPLSGAGSFFIPFGTKLPYKADFLRGYGIWGGIDRLGIPAFLKKEENESIGFLISHGEVLPRKDNRVKLSNQTDEWDIPIPNIEFKWSDNEFKMIKHMTNTMEKAINYSGGKVKDLKSMLNIPLLHLLEKNSSALSGDIPPPGYYIHEVGGAPMGLKEDESVLDKWNRLWSCLLYTSPSPRDE